MTGLHFNRQNLMMLACALLSTAPTHARAETQGHLELETQFMRDTVSPSFFPILKAGLTSQSDPDLKSENEHQVDVTLKGSPAHPKAFTLSSRNAYWGERDDSSVSPLRFSFGRRLVGWSSLDEIWQLGAFEPLDSWDRLRSFSQGLTGIFAFSETASFNFRFFYSYIAVPELTPNIVIENQQFRSVHPQSIASAPSTINLVGQPTPLGYNLNIPALHKILFRPSVAMMMETKPHLPFYGKLSYGYLPLNYFPVALKASLSIPLNQGTVELFPRLLNHHLYSGELGYRFSPELYTGATLMFDHPDDETFASDVTATPLSKSTTFSPWIKFTTPNSDFIVSHIWTSGGLLDDVGPFVNSNGRGIVSSRLLYRNATQLVWKKILTPATHRPTLWLKGVHEYAIKANWIAADFSFYPQDRLRMFVGVDAISAQRGAAPNYGAEFLSDLRAVDRIRLGAHYVF